LAFLKITAYGDPLLRRQSDPIDPVDDEIKQLITDMTDTMQAANGVGLAAPQVGVSKMLMLINWSNLDEDRVEKKVTAYINPQILESGGELSSTEEGCLSLPEVWGEVKRPDYIRIKYQNQDGEEVEEDLRDFPARVFQHEIDHLFGILFIDRMSDSDRGEIKGQLQSILDGRTKPFDPDNIIEESTDNITDIK